MKQLIVSHFSRIAAVLTLCALCVLTLAAGKNEKAASPIDLDAYASLMSNRITRVEDLINRHYDQEDTFALLIPPGVELLNQPGNPDTIVIDFSSKELTPNLVQALLNIPPVYRNSVPTYEIALQETVQGTIEIRDNADQLLYTDPAPAGYVIPYELLFRQSRNPMLYYPELARYRLKTKLTLLPEQYVEHYLYAQARIAEAAALIQEEEGGGMMLMREGMEEEVYISGMREETNGLQLELSYPESCSGSVWSAYSYDAQDTLSKTFMGLESVWTPASSNIVLTGETSVAWIDTRPMGFDEQTNPVHRFYAFGANGIDTDQDGLSDAFEIFSSKTSPTNPDTDADGLSDGEELELGSDPLNPDTDGDGMPDGWEVEYCDSFWCELLPYALSANARGDDDEDGLVNILEYRLGLNPNNAHSLGNGGLDGSILSNWGYQPGDPDADCDLYPDGSDPTPDSADGSIFVIKQALPVYQQAFQDGTGKPVYAATIPFNLGIPECVPGFVLSATLYGRVDDALEVGGKQVAWQAHSSVFEVDLMDVLTNWQSGTFEVDVYDYVDNGWTNNEVGLQATCLVAYVVVAVQVESDRAENALKSFVYGRTDIESPCGSEPGQAESLNVYFSDVFNYGTRQIEDFDVTLRVSPTILQDVTWSKVSGPAESGELLNDDQAVATFRNPTKGGVYQFDATVGGATTRTQVWLPTAGPDISYYWQNEISYFKNTWGPAYRAKLDRITTNLPAILRPIQKHSTALQDMVTIGINLDWMGKVTGSETPCGGPNLLGDEWRQTLYGIVIDFRKRNNMMYALIGREMTLFETELKWGPSAHNAGSPDQSPAFQSYEAGFDLYDGISLQSVMESRGYAMQVPGSWAQKEWPSDETSQGGLTRKAAQQLEALIQ